MTLLLKVLTVGMFMWQSLALLFNEDRVNFIDDLLKEQDKPSVILNHFGDSVKSKKQENVHLCKSLVKKNWACGISHFSETLDHSFYKFSVFLLQINDENVFEILKKASEETLFKVPSRWLLFYTTNNRRSDERHDIEDLLQYIYIGVNTEVYVVVETDDSFKLYLVHKIKRNMQLVWQEYAVWRSSSGLSRLNTDEALLWKRKDLQGAEVVTSTVILDNRTFDDMPQYLNREIDTLTKLVYYMRLHLVEWVNGTEVSNVTRTWGYLQPDGKYNGVVRELADERADFSGSLMVPATYRLFAVNYLLPTAPVESRYIFKKPALASVTNIYALPFSYGVWWSFVCLVFTMTFALVLAYFLEQRVNKRCQMPITQKLSEGFHETLCLVFQQGTPYDPVSVTNREILLLGLLAFMFLYTAYSANVVALLQSATNEINSVETLLSSPLQCGAQDVVYNRDMYKYETRPIHRVFADRKILPQGDQAFLSVQQGIRKVREGMYAFQVELTAGYDEIQKTFFEEEKCNLGSIKYMPFPYPYLGIGKFSHIKEQLRVGGLRIIEGGVQGRTTHRMLPKPPNCGAGAAMFTAVRLLDVAPAFQCLLALYALTLPLLGLEIYTSKRALKKKSKTERQHTNNAESQSTTTHSGFCTQDDI